MHEYQRVVRVADTDVSGVIYFANVQMIALETLEDFFYTQGYLLDAFFQKSPFLFPIVHAEADYLKPIRVGNALNVQMFLEHIGTSSFTIKYLITNQGDEVARVGITHVVIDKVCTTSIPIPKELLTLLKTLV